MNGDCVEKRSPLCRVCRGEERSPLPGGEKPEVLVVEVLQHLLLQAPRGHVATPQATQINSNSDRGMEM